jgi:type I restriction enzyme, R subunit
MKFNEDSRVKIPTILHLCRLGYTYLSLNKAKCELRDWLLPMLMNGQIKIKDAEHLSSKALEKDEELAMATEPIMRYSKEKI